MAKSVGGPRQILWPMFGLMGLMSFGYFMLKVRNEAGWKKVIDQKPGGLKYGNQQQESSAGLTRGAGL